MFREALFIVASNWKQTKCQIVNRVNYIHNTEYYMSIKNELLLHA